ncbi:MAG: hypothetical protein J6X55_07720 [Victivallales bacterium]|nr:hypothetical protein [Victivallales bacterium]
MKRLFFSLLFCTIAMMAQNIVKNGGFDKEDVGNPHTPEGWTRQGDGIPTWEFTDIDGVTTATAVRLVMDAKTSDNASALMQTVKCRPNAEYTLKAMLKGEGCIPVVSVKSLSGEVLAEISSNSAIWNGQSAKFKTNLNMSELKVVISYKAAGQKGMATVDDVMLYAGSEPTSAKKELEPFVAKGENIALNKPYVFSIRPGYRYCTDPGDKTQLTDGIYTQGYFWTQKSTVGWGSRNMIYVTIDLGETFPMGGFCYSTAFGTAGVTMPEFIYVYVSEDNKNWYYVGDLLAESIKERGAPETGSYTTYKAGSNNMPCKGRYVTFLVMQTPYTFIDELEVFKGDASLLAKAPSALKTDAPMVDYFNKRIQSLVENDIKVLENRIAKLPGVAKSKIMNSVADYRKNKLNRLSVGDDDFIPIFPLDDIHRAFYAINGEYLRAIGFSKPIFWNSCRWDNFDPITIPPSKDARPVEVEMMRGEVRAESINILNPTDVALTFKVEVKGLPEGSGIDCREVLGMLTNQIHYSTSALKPGDGASITVEVPAGMSKQLWLSFKRPTLKAGAYNATITATAGKVELQAPLKLTIYDFDFPKEPRMHVGGWDYLNGSGDYYKGKNCIEASIAMMKSIYTDSPWATQGVIPGDAKFDAEGNILNPKELNLTQWDDWTKRWNGARLYCVFLNANRKFYGESMGTTRFYKMVDGFYNAWAAAIKERGLDPKRVVLLIVDEPYNAERDERIIVWAKAIRASKTGFLIFEDPIWHKPEEGSPEMYMSADILCPNTISMTNNEDPVAFRKFFTDYRDKGITLWLYSCSGPARELDPITYHRGQEWWAFIMGAEGSFYWALGCGGGIGDSWHPFKQPGIEYSPFMVSPNNGPMDAKQSEGIREGVQDYEYLCMLRDRIAELKRKGYNARKLAEAEKLLAEAPARALRLTPLPDAPAWIKKNGMNWADQKDRTHMDFEIRKILRMLNDLR